MASYAHGISSLHKDFNICCFVIFFMINGAYNFIKVIIIIICACCTILFFVFVVVVFSSIYINSPLTGIVTGVHVCTHVCLFA